MAAPTGAHLAALNARKSQVGWVDPLSGALMAAADRKVQSEADRRSTYGILEGWVGLFLNAVLFALKLALGVWIGSVALIADSIHTLADSITSAVLIVGSRIARKPPDREHPFGHGRVETIAAVIIAILLAVAGFEFLQSSVKHILAPEPVHAPWWVVGVVLVLAVIKEWNARFAVILARTSGSAAIEADAWHHRSDVFATILVAAGIVGARYGLPILDGIMGVAVSLVILYTAYALAKHSIDPLIGTPPTREDLDRIIAGARSVEEVRGVHDIIVHQYGDRSLISLHVETPASLTPLELHDVAVRVQQRVGEGRKGHVVVHVDPVDRDHPAYDRVRAQVKALVKSDDRVASFHDLRVSGHDGDLAMEVDLVVTAEADREAIADWARGQLRDSLGLPKVVVHVEPIFAYCEEADLPA